MDQSFTPKVDLKSFFKFTFCLFTGFTLGLIYFKIYFKEDFTLQSNVSIKDKHENDTARDRLLYDNFGFYPVNDQGVYTFWNVCIEAPGYVTEASYRGIRYNETQRIAVYNSFYRVGDQSVNVATSGNSVINTWDVIFFRGRIPATHTFHKTTAFFVISTCPSNFHHFWVDQFVPLFNVVQRGNRLKENSQNRIFYRLQSPALTDLASNNCNDMNRYKKFLDTLYLASDPSVFFQAPTNSCYSSAVFGSNTANLKNPRSIINHTINFFLTHSPFFRSLSASSDACTVILQDREYRRIINIDQLLLAAQSIGFKRVCKVAFENLSIERQLFLMMGARVMVGVQGAGLQWAVFMPNGSVLLEVAWPHKHWPFYFQRFVEPYGIRHVQLISHDVAVNWTAYERMVRKGVKVGAVERAEMLDGSGVQSTFDNLWKWADVRVDVASFKNILSSLV